MPTPHAPRGRAPGSLKPPPPPLSAPPPCAFPSSPASDSFLYSSRPARGALVALEAEAPPSAPSAPRSFALVRHEGDEVAPDAIGAHCEVQDVTGSGHWYKAKVVDQRGDGVDVDALLVHHLRVRVQRSDGHGHVH